MDPTSFEGTLVEPPSGTMATKWSRGKKRTATGASLPSPSDPRIEYSLDSCSDGDDDDDDVYLGSASGLLCGAWDRCMDLSRWAASDEESDMVLGENNSNNNKNDNNNNNDKNDNNNNNHGNNNSSSSKNITNSNSNSNSNSNNNNNNNEAVIRPAVAFAAAPASAAASAAAAKAANEAEIWREIDVGHREADTGIGSCGDLSPLAVAPLLPPASIDLGHKTTTISTSDRTGTASASPLEVQRPGSALRRHSFFAGETDREGDASGAESAASAGCRSGGEKMVPRAPGPGGVLACLSLAAGDAARGGRVDGESGGGSPASPSCLGSRSGAGPGAGVATGSQKTHDQGKTSRGRRRQRDSAMAVETLREECDFEGRPTQQLGGKPEDSPFAAAFFAPGVGEEQHLVFTGLLDGGTGGGGQPSPPRDLTCRALFSVSSGRRGAEREVGPLQVGANDRVYGAVQYPSMKELWPDVYDTPAIRVVEVDMLVEVRSRRRDVRYLRAELKVTYRRHGLGNKLGASWRP